MKFKHRPAPEPPKELLIPNSVDGKPCHYFYDSVQVTPADINLDTVHLGVPLTLEPDGDDFLLIQYGKIIGTLSGDKARMARDFKSKGDPVEVYTVGTDQENRKLKVAMAFYEDRVAKAAARGEKPVKLTANTNSDMQGSILSAHVGDLCALADYDYDKGRWLVCCEAGDIGYLKDPDEEYTEQLHPVIASITYNEDTGKYSVSVYVK